MLVASIALLTACAAAAPEEGGTTANAITTAAGVRSPIGTGVYETDEGFLSIAEDADRLHVSAVFDLYAGATVHTLTDCEASLDVHLLDDGVTVDGGKDCSLKLTKTSSGLHVTGRVSGIGEGYSADYVLRDASALLGTYSGGSIAFTAEAAAKGGLRYSLDGRASGKTGAFLAGAGARNLDVGDAFGCPALVEIRRHGAKYEATLVTGAEAILDGAADSGMCSSDVDALSGTQLAR